MATISITDFGAIGNGSFNCQTAIQNCFNNAAANNHDVFIPAGTYNHSGTLTFNASGRRLFGVGTTSMLKATVAGQEALFITGNDVEVDNFHTRGFGAPRMSADITQSIVFQVINGLHVHHMHVDKTTTGGMKFNGCWDCHVHDNLVEDTHADSIHFTIGGGRASRDCLAEFNTVRLSGDDGIASVSYGGVGAPSNTNITIRFNDIRFNTNGRGIGIIGSMNVLVRDNEVHGGTSDKAGIYVAAESAYNTTSLIGCCVHNNHLTDCGSAGSTGHGSIFVYNSQPGAQCSGVAISGNTITNSRRHGLRLFGGQPISINHYNNVMVGGAFPYFSNGNTNGGTVVSTAPVATCPPGTQGFKAPWACGSNRLVA